MDYDSTLNWLFGQTAKGVKFGLDNTIEILSRLGNPHHKFRSLHVAGTNGKGSVSAMSESVIREAGYRTGLYTSPHLVDFRERIRVCGNCISKEKMLHLAEELKTIADDMSSRGKQPTFFELTTAMAFTHFADMDIDIAVVEVGMGGRLDSTNVINPECVTITNISAEHTSFLGPTLSSITSEKAGIIKPGIPVVTSNQSIEVLDVLKKRASELSSPFAVVGDGDFKVLSSTLDGIEVYVESIDNIIHLPLAGSYQGQNCALACSALMELMHRGIYIPEESFAQGLTSVQWPGRLEVVSQCPRIIFDVSHTAEGVRTVVAELERLLDRKVIVVLGVLDDKDLDAIAFALRSITRYTIATAPNTSRAFPAQRVNETMSKYCPSEAVSDVPRAIERAISLASEDDVILVIGSLYTIGEAKRWLNGETC
ncbi:MAG: bifunctional folylpolyglutamate synthase/dihydrofolate synthase [Euryarchaeota archaeon]|nr:bifunctional folylpolyglutamate synthase/dihydrofolate synthase [Euryarchaeota archaeon]